MYGKVPTGSAIDFSPPGEEIYLSKIANTHRRCSRLYGTPGQAMQHGSPSRLHLPITVGFSGSAKNYASS